jgi:hypothetical protein
MASAPNIDAGYQPDENAARQMAEAIHAGLKTGAIGIPWISPVSEIEEGDVTIDGHFDLLAVAKAVLISLQR